MELSSASLDDVARELGRALAGWPGLRLAVLFGSWARGRATAGSDIDLAVLGRALDRLELGAALGRSLGCEVDVVSLEAADIPLLQQIVRDGIVVYEGARGAAASWRSHALSELELDGPWYARMRDAWLERVARSGIQDGRR